MKKPASQDDLRAFVKRLGEFLVMADTDGVLSCMSRYGRARVLSRLYGPAAVWLGFGVMLNGSEGWSWRIMPTASKQWSKGQFILRDAEGQPLHVSRVRIRRSNRRYFLEDFGPIPWRVDPDNPNEVTPVVDRGGPEVLVHGLTYDIFENIKASLPIVTLEDLDPIARQLTEQADGLGMSMRQVASGVCLWDDYKRKAGSPRGRANGWVAGLLHTIARLDALSLTQAQAGDLTGVSGATTGQRFKDLCLALNLEHYDIRYGTMEMALLDLWGSIGTGPAPRRPLYKRY